MKEQWRINKEKFAALEEGFSGNGESPIQRRSENNGTCKQLMQCLKFILYVELTLFIGWACYTMWQTYQVHPIEVKVADNTRGPQPQSIDNENPVLQASTIRSHDFGEFERIHKKFVEMPSVKIQKIREQSSSVIEPVVSPKRIHTFDLEWSWRRDPALSGMSFDSEKKELLSTPVTDAVKITDPEDAIPNISEEYSKEDSFESAQEEGDVLELAFPFLWSIHGLKDLDSSGLKEQKLGNVLDDKQILTDTPSIAESRVLEQSASSETNPIVEEQSAPSYGFVSSTGDLMDQDYGESSKELDWDAFTEIVRRIRMESDLHHNQENVESAWNDQTIVPNPLPLTFQRSSEKLDGDESESSFQSDERQTSSGLPLRVFTSSDITNDSWQSSISSSSDTYAERGIPTSYPSQTQDRQIVTDLDEEPETNEDEQNSDIGDPKLQNFQVLKCTSEVVNDSIVEKCELTDLSYTQEEVGSDLHTLIDSILQPNYNKFSHRDSTRSISSRQASEENNNMLTKQVKPTRLSRKPVQENRVLLRQKLLKDNNPRYQILEYSVDLEKLMIRMDVLKDHTDRLRKASISSELPSDSLEK